MCYLIATRNDEKGCIALKHKQDAALSHLHGWLTWKTLGKGIEILLVGNPRMYSEYAPYKIMDNELDFISAILNNI